MMMKKYLVTVGLLSALLFGACGLVNYLVDPFQLYHFNIGDADTLGRVEQFENMRFYKPQHVRRVKPEALVIGSSRSGGLQPEQPSWQGLASYNFSVPGITAYEMLRSVQHANAIKPLSRLAIGIDFEEFIKPYDRFRPGFAEARMLRSPKERYSPGYWMQRFSDIRISLFSFDVLMQSIEAVVERAPKIRRYFSNGAWEPVSRKLTGRGGYVFTGRNMLILNEKGGLNPQKNLQQLRKLLRFCYRNNIETRLFFTPTHAFLVDFWYRQGHRSMWQDLRRQVLQINIETAKEFGRSPFDLVGFDQLSGIVDEPIYRARDIDKAWFSDGVHFRPRLSQLIMASLWDGDSDFGRRLSAENIEVYLQEVDELRESFVHSNGDMLEDVHSRISPK
ncbi:MAG: hypothetical protein V7754_12035 [Halioglobus sp.]